MADTTATALAAFSTIDPAADAFPGVDVSDLGGTPSGAGGTNKKATPDQIVQSTDAVRATSAPGTDNLLVRTDGTGRLVKGSVAALTDAGALSGLLSLALSGDITVGGLVDGVDIDALATAVAALADGMVFQGTFDAGGTTGPVNFPGSGSAQAGAFYVVTNANAAGTAVGSSNAIEVHAGDKLVAATDDASATDGAEWVKLDDTDEVSSVAGKTGAVTLVSADLSDVSAFMQTVLDDANSAAALATLLAAPLASPAFGGTPTAPTAAPATNTTQLATTAFVTAAVASGPSAGALAIPITIESPSSSEDISWFFTPVAITVTQLVAVLVGSATPSVTWTIRHGPDRSDAGNEIITGGTATTSISTGDDLGPGDFDDATIPADSFVWIETTAQSGTVPSILLQLTATED